MGKDNGNVGAGEKRFSQEEMTFDKINNVLARISAITNLFGENEGKVKKKYEELQMAFALAQADNKNIVSEIPKGFDRMPDKRYSPNIQADLAEKVESLLDVVDESLSSGIPAKNTYAGNVLLMVREQIGMVFDPDYDLLTSRDRLQDCTWEHIVDFPTNYFATGDPEKDKRREFIKDDARYEDFMGKYSGFYDMMADRTDFVKNDLFPYMKRKKEGKISEREELQFNMAYSEHLDRQIGYWEKIKEYPEEEMLKIDPFARSPIQFTMNWAGDRGVIPALNEINFQKKAIANGWSLEDITFLGNMRNLHNSVYNELEGYVKRIETEVDTLQNLVNKAKDDVQKADKEYNSAVQSGDHEQIEEKHKALTSAQKEQSRREDVLADKRAQLQMERQAAQNSPWVKDAKKLNNAYRRLMETVVRTPSERRKLIEDMKPFVDKWNNIKANEKNKRDNKIITSCDEALKRDDLGHLTAEHSKRREIIKSLEVFQKQLNQGHRIGTHTDSPEMKDLKKKLNTALRALKDNKKGIYDDKTMSDLLQDISKSARAYTDAKKEGAGVDKGSTTYLPKTKMGKIRYQAAMDLEKAMKNYSVKMKNGFVSNQVGKRMKEKGFKVVSADDIHMDYGLGTFQARTMIGMNYFSKEPTCIPEHCTAEGNITFSEAEFEKQCKPYKLDGVSNEEFAFTAYAAICNPSVIPKEFDERYPMKDVDDPAKNVPHDELVRTRRAMYAMDFFRDPPRASMGLRFNDLCLVNAREAAFQALTEYKAGKPEKLAGLLATGMKEIHNETLTIEDIYNGGACDFYSHTTMMSGMIGMMKKDPKLMEQVKNQLGPEMVEDIRDDLRLKDFIDRAENAKQKLKDSAQKNRPLSNEEKKACMQDIMRIEFTNEVRRKAWSEMLSGNEKYMECANNETAFIKNCVINKSTLTAEDYAAKKHRLQREALKPVYKVTKALRTQEGMQIFENTVSQLTDKVDINKSEKALLADANGLKKQLSNIQKPEKKVPARTTIKPVKEVKTAVKFENKKVVDKGPMKK